MQFPKELRVDLSNYKDSGNVRLNEVQFPKELRGCGSPYAVVVDAPQ